MVLAQTKGMTRWGAIQACMDVLKALNPDGNAKLASAPPLKENGPKVEVAKVRFVANSWDSEQRDEFFHFVFGTQLKKKLASGEFVPSPNIQVVQGGLKNVQKRLDIWNDGVSGAKIVLEL